MNNWKKIFAIIWTGQLFSILSSTVVGFSLVIWLSIKTESAEVLAFGTMAALLPQSILGLVSGVFVDRWNRKLTMIFSDTFIAVCTLVLAIIFFLGTPQIWHIYLLLSFRSVGSAFHGPAMQASVPLLAPPEQLTRIAGISTLINSICNIAGPALGALLIGFMDISYILLLDIAGAAIACTSLLFVKIPNPERKEESKLNIVRDMKEALQGVRSVKGLSTLFLIAIACTFVMMPVSVLFPLMTLKHFNGNEIDMGIVEAGWGVGMLLGGAIVSIISTRLNKVLMINAMYLLLGLSFFLSGLLSAEAFWWFVVFAFVGGMAGSIYYAYFISVVQIKVEPALLGRVFSSYISVSLLPSMIVLVSTGFIADNIGMDITFIISGALVMLLGVISYLNPQLTKLGILNND